MIRCGILDADKVGHRWLIDPASVERRHSTEIGAGAPLRPESAWAILLLQSGQAADWLTPWGLSRTRRRLRNARLKAFAPRLRRRAMTHRLRAHPGDLARLAREPAVAKGGVSAAVAYDVHLSAPGVLEAYLPARHFPRLSRKYLLEPASDPNLILHVVDGHWPFPRSCKVVPAPVVAFDLLEADDPRTRRAGKELLERLEPG